MNPHNLYARLSPYFRRRRIRWMLQRLPFDRAASVLDVGGTPWFWRDISLPARITCLNASLPAQPPDSDARMTCVEGDGCALPYADRSFDIVFSNSVIEHVGDFERQRSFAEQVRRVGRHYWVQTPSRHFFFEPHLLAPFIHWLPAAWKRRLARRGTLWGWMTRPGRREAKQFADGIRLLSASEMRALFPDGVLLRERFLGMTKSLIACR